MRRIGLIVLLLAFAIAAGFASVRLQRPAGVSVPAHTITYRLISYDNNGNVTRTSVVIRKVLSDGTWNHTQINPDGPVVSSNGKMKHLVTSKSAEANHPEHLGFKYIETKNADSEAWISPELQDLLMFTELREDGSKGSRLEAVQISKP